MHGTTLIRDKDDNKLLPVSHMHSNFGHVTRQHLISLNLLKVSAGTMNHEEQI